MKRHIALRPLSRDHHQALVIARRLRHANRDTAAETAAAFLQFWHTHGLRHFREEEEILLPAYAEHGDPEHPLVARVLVDHVVIRRGARRLETAGAASPADLRELGERLTDHVRLEERQLFPLIEEAMPAEAATALAEALAETEGAPPA
ncbi:MAG TPA: hemerythrin domain-containing protein [Trueperaceae bacterium]|nr:hemerythrin domain-containing protein [Trueperaceae bacterium]